MENPSAESDKEEKRKTIVSCCLLELVEVRVKLDTFSFSLGFGKMLERKDDQECFEGSFLRAMAEFFWRILGCMKRTREVLIDVI